jgi:hypothetical protein
VDLILVALVALYIVLRVVLDKQTVNKTKEENKRIQSRIDSVLHGYKEYINGEDKLDPRD